MKKWNQEKKRKEDNIFFIWKRFTKRYLFFVNRIGFLASAQPQRVFLSCWCDLLPLERTVCGPNSEVIQPHEQILVPRMNSFWGISDVGGVMGRKGSSRTQPILCDNHTQVTCQCDTCSGKRHGKGAILCYRRRNLCLSFIRFENMDDSRRTLL